MQADSTVGDHTSNEAPTQVSNPRRASWRTFIQVLLAFLPTANGVLVCIQIFLSTQPMQSVVPEMVFVITNGLVLAGAFLAKVLAEIMANPIVNSWIEDNVPAIAPTARSASNSHSQGDDDAAS